MVNESATCWLAPLVMIKQQQVRWLMLAETSNCWGFFGLDLCDVKIGTSRSKTPAAQRERGLFQQHHEPPRSLAARTAQEKPSSLLVWQVPFLVAITFRGARYTTLRRRAPFPCPWRRSPTCWPPNITICDKAGAWLMMLVSSGW